MHTPLYWIPEIELGQLAIMPRPRPNEIEFISFPINDRQVPASKSDVRQLIDTLWNHLKQEKSIAMHCRMGVGRSALIAACLLVRTNESIDTHRAFESIAQNQGVAVPDTPEQYQWVVDLHEQ
ncbi:MAG: dual specificity protein phosphatase family protein [Chloroflexota bacterium]